MATVDALPAWAVDAEHTDDRTLEVRDPDGWYTATVRSDGCVDLSRYFNRPDPQPEGREDEHYLHICDIDDLILRLESLKRAAVDHFGSAWER